MDLKKISHLFYWLFIAKPSGLDKTPVDDRDFKTGLWGWGAYTPKHQSYTIKTISIKDQNPFNTCQWNATTIQKEVDENVALSVRDLVSYAKKNGMVSGDGFSNLRDGQKCLQDRGIAEDNLVMSIFGDFADYIKLDTDALAFNASKHKISSYWRVSSRNDILKLLDSDHLLTTGIDWYTGFNQGGGFSAPWIISKAVGYIVGGHAITIIGYNLNYFGKKVYIMQNSYGKDWGDGGKFYIEMAYLEANNYGVFTNLDIDVDTGSFLTQYDGKNVKCKEDPTIYFIQAGKKKAYLHEMDYFVYNVNDPMMKNFEIVEKSILDKIETGDNMELEKSVYWPVLKHLEYPLNLTRIMEAIKLSKLN